MTAVAARGGGARCEMEADGGAVSPHLHSLPLPEGAAGHGEPPHSTGTATKPPSLTRDGPREGSELANGKNVPVYKNHRKASAGLLQGASAEVPGHASSPSLPPKPQATPNPSTKASSSMSRDHITMISHLRHPQGWFQVHGDQSDFAPRGGSKSFFRALG